MSRRADRSVRAAPPRRAGPIDIIFLVTRLQTLVANGKKLPMTNNVVIDKDAAFDLIDELRAAIPEEIRAAKRINAEGERIIEKAQEEAERIVARAQEQAAFLIEERGLTAAADEESRRIVGQAQDESAEVRRGADEYAASVLIGLEREVVQTLQAIKKGIALLDERRATGVPADDGRPTTTRAGTTRRSWRRIARPDPSGRDRARPGGPADGQRREPPRRAVRLRPRLRLRRVQLDLDRAGRIADAVDDLPLADPHRPRRAGPRSLPPGPDEPRALRRRRRRDRPGRDLQSLPPADRRRPGRRRSTRRPCRASTSPPAPRSTPSAEPEVARLTDHHEIDLEPFVREAILARRADRPALPAGLSRVSARSAASSWRAGRTTTRTRRSTPGSRRSGRSGSTGTTRPRKLFGRPPSARGTSADRSPAATRRRTRRRPRPPDRSRRGATRDHGSPQATRLARPSGRAPQPPRDRAAEARGVPALPRVEAAPPRLPELRLLRWPPGGGASRRSRATRPPEPVDLSAVRASSGSGPVRVAVDAMGGDHAPEEVVLGALDHAAEHPDVDVILVGDRDRIAAIAGDRLAAANVSSSTPPRSSGWTSTRPSPCARRRTPRSSSRPTSSGAARPTPSSRPATPGPGWPRRSCGSADCRASTGPPSPSR